MINFAEGWSPENEYLQMSKSEIKELIKELINSNPYSVGSFHGDLSLTNVKEIINYLMYTQNNDSIQITIDKESNKYHLSIMIDSKSNNS
tara:strand:+ start:175 stop:444 length:270 start_codon:yes stop_codon:yes gene_type:complete